ncbi:hypothetical protein AUJ68_03730 [Candidatus Woesearchaeota archaeon CG1_02_57_44]|nr:MAG: hypothetical protein AUJ68_03730 [Candidatus Woesearchaeota archaeon CG1_02_57_44]
MNPSGFFSQETNRYYKLLPTPTWPTIEISGIRMHRVESMDPKSDTERKIAQVAPVQGKALDICTGLGYTAILLAREADSVTTIERDANVLALARENLPSKELFSSPKIKQLMGDAQEVVKSLPDAHFDIIIHDPPSLNIAGDLYASSFYQELFRLLKPGGRMFHYTGMPGRSRGVDLIASVAKRLKLIGFDAQPVREALGVKATKHQ